MKLRQNDIADLCGGSLGKIKNCLDFFYFRSYYKDFLYGYRDFFVCSCCPEYYRNFCYKRSRSLDTDTISCNLINPKFRPSFLFQKHLSIDMGSGCRKNCWWCQSNHKYPKKNEFFPDKFEKIIEQYPLDTVLISGVSEPLESYSENKDVLHTIIDICEKYDKYVNIRTNSYLLDKFDILDRVNEVQIVCYKDFYDIEKKLSIEYAMSVASVKLIFVITPEDKLFRRNYTNSDEWYRNTIRQWLPFVDGIELHQCHFDNNKMKLAGKYLMRKLVQYFYKSCTMYIDKFKFVSDDEYYYYYLLDGSIYDDHHLLKKVEPNEMEFGFRKSLNLF